jgi:hypothetical protein
MSFQKLRYFPMNFSTFPRLQVKPAKQSVINGGGGELYDVDERGSSAERDECPSQIHAPFPASPLAHRSQRANRAPASEPGMDGGLNLIP